MLALLKIVAWEDRHRRFPVKDAADLNLILRNYLAISVNQQRLWNDFIKWTESPDFDYEHSGARMLGYDIRRLVSDQGLSKLDGILRAQLNQDDPGELPREMDRRSPQQALAFCSGCTAGSFLTAEGRIRRDGNQEIGTDGHRMASRADAIFIWTVLRLFSENTRPARL